MHLLRAILISVVVLISDVLIVVGQTNISGGIYSNTTWTLLNSPYTLIGHVVVFPGVTLTIEPGVIVQFSDSTRIEIRQSQLVAIGTVTDSIIFTGVLAPNSPGNGIYFNGGSMTSHIDYCKFEYNDNAIYSDYNTYDTLYINHSTFINNNSGVSSILGGGQQITVYIDSCMFLNNAVFGLNDFSFGHIQNSYFENNQTGLNANTACTINNNIFRNNQTGLFMGSGNIIYDCVANANQYGINVIGNNKVMNCIADSNIVSGIILANTDSLINCTMRNNGIGLHSYASLGGGSIITKNIIENNNIGIKLEGYADSIYCNRICNSSSYDLYYNVLFGSNSIVANNDWCTIDSISTSAVIFDGYDDVNLGLVSFLPIDTLQCYLNSSVIYSGHPTTIFTIFPNPTTNSITVQLFSDHRTTIKILNLLGEVLYVTSTSTREKEIDISW